MMAFSENACILGAVCSKVLEQVLWRREQGPWEKGKPSSNDFSQHLTLRLLQATYKGPLMIPQHLEERGTTTVPTS